MNSNDYTALVTMLIEKRIELSRRTESIRSDLHTGSNRDKAEQAIEEENHDILRELSREAIEELSKVNMALARHDAGTFGSCVSCGQTITGQRLTAVPWAADCVVCAIKNEARRRR